jgi:ShK domain-like
MGATLSHATSGLLPSGIQDVCRFNVIPLRVPVDCEDSSSSCGTTPKSDCIGGDFLHHMHVCEKMCGFCEGCVDKHSNCKQWSSEGHCRYVLCIFVLTTVESVAHSSRYRV